MPRTVVMLPMHSLAHLQPWAAFLLLFDMMSLLLQYGAAGWEEGFGRRSAQIPG